MPNEQFVYKTVIYCNGYDGKLCLCFIRKKSTITKNLKNEIKDEKIQTSGKEKLPKEQDGLLLVRLYLNNLEQVACSTF